MGRLVVRSPQPSRGRLRLIGPAAGIDEHGDHHRQLAAIDQVVEHVRRRIVAVHVEEGMAVLKDHQTRRLCGVVLRRHKHRVRVLRARKDLARQRVRPNQLSLRNAFLLEGVGAELVVFVVALASWGFGQRLAGNEESRNQAR